MWRRGGGGAVVACGGVRQAWSWAWRRADASADLEVLKDVLEGALRPLPTVNARHVAIATLDQALGRELGERLGAGEEGL